MMAAYFVLAKQQRDVVAFVHPDCTTDYRRQRTLWMSADELLRDDGARQPDTFAPLPTWNSSTTSSSKC